MRNDEEMEDGQVRMISGYTLIPQLDVFVQNVYIDTMSLMKETQE